MLLEAAVLIYRLEEDRLYSPWQVAASGYDRDLHRQDYDRIRLNLGEWSRYHNIRETFENRDETGKRQGRFPAWYGKTWKEHLGHKDIEAARNWIAQEEKKTQGPQVEEAAASSVEQDQTEPAQSANVSGRRRPLKYWRWAMAVLPLAAAATIFLAMPTSVQEGSSPNETPAAMSEMRGISAKTDKTGPPPQLSVAEFTAARVQARLQRKPFRAPQFHHPPVQDLTWEMTLIDGPLLDQVAIMPNCVFLVSRTHKDMMPFLE